jgi:2-polyprenyl-6-methoxyphenol hydroxylase-like FAD-dependent oxidoreductase
MRILIIGAGIAGLSMALSLERVGIYAKIIEKNPQLNINGAGIALPMNAVSSLSYLGLNDTIMEHAKQVHKITYALPDGEVLSTGSLLESPLNHYPFVALDRKSLITLLSNSISSKIEFGKYLTELSFADKSQEIASVKFNDGESSTFDLVIGADGINSTTRMTITGKDEREDLGIAMWRFISNFKQEEPIYYFGKRSVFMIYPISSTQVYCYAHVADPIKNSVVKKDHLSALFGEYPALVNWLIRSAQQKDIIFGRMKGLSQPSFNYKNIVFIGDAAHACSPMLQQGAACAFEDAITLTRMIKAFPDLHTAITEYKNIRLPRINWIRENSNVPIKAMSSYINDHEYEKRNNNIRIHGPINILKWKTLFSENYFDLLDAHIERAKQLKNSYLNI